MTVFLEATVSYSYFYFLIWENNSSSFQRPFSVRLWQSSQTVNYQVSMLVDSTETGTSVYSSDKNKIYSNINKSSETEMMKSPVRCRKTSASSEYFHNLKHNTQYSVNFSLIQNSVVVLTGSSSEFLETETCWVQFTAEASRSTCSGGCGSEGEVDERSVVLLLVFWTPPDERRAQVDQLLSRNNTFLVLLFENTS